MRVAEFTDNYGPGRSGILYAVQQLERSLLQAGHDVLVVAPTAEGPNPLRFHPRRHEVRLPSVRLAGVPARIATGYDIQDRLALVEQWAPDVIHAHGLGVAGLSAMTLARRTGIPLVLTWHTDFEAYAEHYPTLVPVIAAGFWAWRRWAGEDAIDDAQLRQCRHRLTATCTGSLATVMAASATLLRSADVVTAPSPKTAHRIRRLAPGVRPVVIPNGVDCLPASDLRLLPTDGVRFSYIGRISPEKGIGVLVDAYEEVTRTIDDARLMLVGDWRRTAGLRLRLSRARRSLPGLDLVGEVDRDRLRPYYDASDVFVFPSVTDTQALVLHEAAHAGLPIVSCDPELGMVLEDGVNCCFARPEPSDLAQSMIAMAHAIADPDFRARAASTSRRLASRFTMERQDAAMMAVYARLAAGLEPVRQVG